LLANGQWFSPDTPAFSTTKTGHHDVAETLLKVALNTKTKTKKYIFECTNLSQTRKLLLPKHLMKRPNIIKFKNLITNKTETNPAKTM
jgi:hypothetical protein